MTNSIAEELAKVEVATKVEEKSLMHIGTLLLISGIGILGML